MGRTRAEKNVIYFFNSSRPNWPENYSPSEQVQTNIKLFCEHYYHRPVVDRSCWIRNRDLPSHRNHRKRATLPPGGFTGHRRLLGVRFFLLLLKVGHHVVACSRPCFFPAWTGKRASLCLSLSLDVINYYFSIKTKLFLAVVSRWVELAVHIISIFHSFLIDYTNYN